jgi:site-specific DNA-adenine methylase
MLPYHGGKSRICKQIAKAIYENTNTENIRGYVEPFCGALGVYQYIPNLFSPYKLKYKGSDINKSLISMIKKAQKGWKPPTRRITKKEFQKYKYDGKISANKGFIGHVYSFRGVYLGGYFSYSKTKIEHNSKNVQRITKELKNVKFTTGDYTQFSKLKKYIIYCDPPYADTQQKYSSGEKFASNKFDNSAFWKWAVAMSKYNVIFVSEYTKPKFVRAKCVWKQDKEKLFKLSPPKS